MKKTFILALLITMVSLLAAQSLLTDDFTGLTVGNNLAGQSSWTKGGSGPNPTIGNTTALSYANYNGGGGEYVIMPTGSSTTSRVYKGFTSTAVGTNTFYYSFLLRVSSVGTSNYFITLGDPVAGTTYAARVFAKSSGTGFNLGASKSSSTATYNASPTTFNFNQSYLVVMRYTAVSGITNDLVYMWVNPSLSSEPLTSTAEVTVPASENDPGFSGGNIGNFHWHHRAAGNPVGAFDGVRVAYGATSAAAWTNLNAYQSSLATEPTAQPTALVFNDVTSTSYDVAYTAASGSPAGYLSVRRQGSAPTGTPIDGKAYAVNDTLGANGTVVYSGSNLTYSQSSLNPSTTYYYKVFSFNGSGSTTNYLQTNPLSGNQTTQSGVVLPTVTTTTITTITSNTAIGGGNVTADGGGSITDRGICWGTSSNPTTSNSTFSNGAGSTGAYTSSLASLSANQLYHVRAYAVNSAGTAYGDDITFTTLKAEPSNHVGGFAVGTPTASAIPLSWTDAAKVTPDGYLIKGSDVGYGSIVAPSDGTAEINSLLVRNITQGTQNWTFAGLTPNTTYYFKIYPYTNSGTGIDYKTDETVPQVSGATMSVTALSPGDIAIIAFQVDTPDQFAFITFVPINDGTEIKFTDNGWTDAGAFYTGEGTVIWTAPASKLAAGQIVTVTAGTPWTVDKGTVATSGSPAFATAGDQLIAYQGLSNSPTLLYALSTTPWVTSGTITANTTYLPTGLTNNITAIDFSIEYDNQYYNKIPISGTPEQILASLGNESNWTASNDWLTIPNWGEVTLPVELSSFTATMTAQNTVSIMWVTQSETNVNGYYVHRGVNSELSAATIVSPLIAATNTSQQQYYQFTDSEVFEAGTYYYWLQAQDLDGSVVYHGPTTVYYDNGNPGTPVIPKITELKSVYPNPFNPNTTISYSLATPATVDFIIYNGRGQIVRNFSEGSKGIGTHQLQWNGSDNSGRECSTGVYYIKMFAGKDSFIRKAVLLK